MSPVDITTNTSILAINLALQVCDVSVWTLISGRPVKPQERSANTVVLNDNDYSLWREQARW